MCLSLTPHPGPEVQMTPSVPDLNKTRPILRFQTHKQRWSLWTEIDLSIESASFKLISLFSLKTSSLFFFFFADALYFQAPAEPMHFSCKGDGEEWGGRSEPSLSWIPFGLIISWWDVPSLESSAGEVWVSVGGTLFLCNAKREASSASYSK